MLDQENKTLVGEMLLELGARLIRLEAEYSRADYSLVWSCTFTAPTKAGNRVVVTADNLVDVLKKATGRLLTEKSNTLE